ncbi:MAG: glycosyltransferase family 2 protein [Gammaproteobacteria bacterium]|nr:glycosyltransferase family 2 protein [Gammaproteobacteria bacterium]
MSNKTLDFPDATVTLSASAQHYHLFEKIGSPYEGNEIDLTLFISCYNEEIFIEDTLAVTTKAMTIVGKTYEIIVIDDGSKDRSVELVQKFINQNPDINIILRVNKKNKGLAQNYIDGAFIGRGKYYRLICGDNAEPIETIVSVLKMIGEADIIVPYYTSAQGKSAYRQFVSRIYTHIINLVSGNKINYYNGLQIHLRYNVMRWHPNTRGFGFQAGLLCLLLDMGFTYKQIPCITIERRGGGGNAITLRNLRSVIHTIVSILLRRMAPSAKK